MSYPSEEEYRKRKWEKFDAEMRQIKENIAKRRQKFDLEEDATRSKDKCPKCGEQRSYVLGGWPNKSYQWVCDWCDSAEYLYYRNYPK